MHNISAGDIFTDSNEIYRVLEVFDDYQFPYNPYLIIEKFVSGIGFEEEESGFTLQQSKEYKLQHYKLTK